MNIKLMLLLGGWFLSVMAGFIAPVPGGIARSFSSTDQILTAPSPDPGNLDLTFAASLASNTNLIVNTTLAQPDGKIIVGGTFITGGDLPHNGVVRLDAQGKIDLNFSGGTGVGGQNPEIKSLALQPDGKILVGGNFNIFNNVARNNLVRLNSDGSLDSTFNIGSGTSGGVSSVIVQPNGKILIGGDFFQVNGNSQNRIARLNSDGSFDASFNLGGTGPDSTVYSVAYQSDGKVLLGGIFGNYNGTPRGAFLRLNADGSVDNTFNIGTGAGFRIFTIFVQADDRILIGGFFSSFNGVPRNNVARLNADGSLDAAFNPNVGNEVLSVAAQADGKVLVGGNFNSVNNQTRGSLVRLNQDGSVDSAYPAGVGFMVRSIVLQNDGKAVVGGEFSTANGTPRNAVARFEIAGNLDTTFDAVIGFAGTTQTLSVYPNGKVLVAGFFNSVSGVRKNRLVRLNADGSPDSSFDTGAGADDQILATAIQADGKILIGGDFSFINGISQRAISRLNSDGTIDSSFNLPGGIGSRVRSITILRDGKILVGGGFITVGGQSRAYLARLNLNGSLDTGFTPQVNGDVYSTVEQPGGKVVIGGSFTQVNNTTQNGVARLNSDGTLDAAFNTGSGAGGQIFSVALQSDGKIIVGGFFTAFNNIQSRYIARLNTDGSVDANFSSNGGASSTVFSIDVQPDGKVIVGGDFAAFNSQIHRGIVRLRSDGSTDQFFNPVIARSGFSGPTILKVVVVPEVGSTVSGKLLIGGRYTDVNGYGRIGISRLNLRFGDTKFDFDRDGKADVSVFRPANGAWYLQQSSAGFTGITFGFGTDKLVPADYDGDGKTDVAVYRNGTWYLLRSSLGFTGIAFGASDDIPVPSDYDGDGKADIAVFRPSNGTWYIQGSTVGFYGAAFGISTDKPVPADYDGDGKTDIAVNRSGTWYLQRSQLGFYGVQFGDSNDKLVPADYDGDGKTDLAVFRPSNGTWYLNRSTTGFAGFAFGLGTDLPAPADYDGDGRADLGVYRSGTWYLNRSTQGFVGLPFGTANDKPVPSAFVQ